MPSSTPDTITFLQASTHTTTEGSITLTNPVNWVACSWGSSAAVAAGPTAVGINGIALNEGVSRNTSNCGTELWYSTASLSSGATTWHFEGTTGRTIWMFFNNVSSNAPYATTSTQHSTNDVIGIDDTALTSGDLFVLAGSRKAGTPGWQASVDAGWIVGGVGGAYEIAASSGIVDAYFGNATSDTVSALVGALFGPSSSPAAGNTSTQFRIFLMG